MRKLIAAALLLLCVGGANAAQQGGVQYSLPTVGTTQPITDNSTNLATTAYTSGRPEFANILTSNMTGVSNATWTKVTLGSPPIDNKAGWSGTNHNYVIPTAGKYRIAGSCDIVVTTTGGQQQGCTVSKNGAPGVGTQVTVAFQEPAAGTGIELTVVTMSTITTFAASDTVELDAYITGATTLTVNSTVGTQLYIEWVGP